MLDSYPQSCVWQCSTATSISWALNQFSVPSFHRGDIIGHWEQMKMGDFSPCFKAFTRKRENTSSQTRLSRRQLLEVLRMSCGCLLWRWNDQASESRRTYHDHRHQNNNNIMAGTTWEVIFCHMGVGQESWTPSWQVILPGTLVHFWNFRVLEQCKSEW